MEECTRNASRTGENKDPRKKLCPQFSDIAIMLNGDFQEHLRCDIDNWPLQVDPGKGIYCQTFWWDIVAWSSLN